MQDREGFLTEPCRAASKAYPNLSARGGISLYEMVASGYVPKTSFPGIPDGEPYKVGNTFNDVERKALETAVSASKLEQAILKANQPPVRTVKANSRVQRGMIMKHRTLGIKVTVLQCDIDITNTGEPKHLVMSHRDKQKYRVPESKLQSIQG